jgi:cobalamin biosynthesis protein CbiD
VAKLVLATISWQARLGPVELPILDSARKRGYSDEDLLHAVAFAVRIYRQDDGLVMFVGPDRAGRVMEVGVAVLRDGNQAIIHAMRPARQKFLPTKPQRKR